MLSSARQGTGIIGISFWAWAGEGRAPRPGGFWRHGDDFIGDPPHEPQGWYSVYHTDHELKQLIAQYAHAFQRIP